MNIVEHIFFKNYRPSFGSILIFMICTWIHCYVVDF